LIGLISQGGGYLIHPIVLLQFVPSDVLPNYSSMDILPQTLPYRSNGFEPFN